MPRGSRLENGPGDGIGEEDALRAALALLVGWSIPRFERFHDKIQGDLEHWWSEAAPTTMEWDFLTKGQQKQLKKLHRLGIAKTAEMVRSWSGRVLCYDEEDYPPMLKELDKPPVAIHVLGHVEALHQRGIAVVGSRKITVAAVDSMRRILQPAIGGGMALISGGALGADAEAHRGALSVGGTTVAILPAGLQRLSPRTNIALFEEMVAKGGALVSEYPPNQGVRNYHFERRNKLIAAMSLGVFVVRAARKSGTMLTVKAARELSRPLAAMPGAPADPLSEGCHHILRQGAELIASPENMQEWWTSLSSGLVRNTMVRTDRPARQQQMLRPACEVLDSAVTVLDDQGAFSVEAVARLTGKSAAELQSVLLTHELSGVIERVAGGERYQMVL